MPNTRDRQTLEPANLAALTRREIRQLERIAEEQRSASTGRRSLSPQTTSEERPVGSADGPSVNDPDLHSSPEPQQVVTFGDLPSPPPIVPTECAADVTPGMPGSGRGGQRKRQVPLETPAPAAPAPKRTKNRATRAMAVVALSFSALLVAATSLTATNTSLSFASTPSAAELQQQELLTVGAAPGQPISRDGYSATEVQVVAELKAAVAGYNTANTFTNNPASAVQWPFPVGVPISDGFGPRVAPTAGASSNHKGVDFTPGEGTPVNAVAAGVVRLVQETDQGGLGVYVVIDHVIDGVSVSSWYGHMLTGSPVVTEGQLVVAGQQIGAVGNTGISTGAHTHLEIHVENTPVDPFAWISARN